MNWQRGRSYGQDLRDKMFAAIDRGMNPGAVAMAFAVSVSGSTRLWPGDARRVRRRLVGSAAMWRGSWMLTMRRSARGWRRCPT